MSTARLHVLYDPPARAADIVFVHGLGRNLSVKI